MSYSDQTRRNNAGYARPVFASLMLLALVFAPGVSNALPNFARQYEKNCAMCHTQVPKLNRTGYEFRMAGFRLPEEIGEKPGDFNLGDFFAARLQMSLTDKEHDPATGPSASSTDLEFKEVTLYPLTGSWGSNFGVLTELSMSPDDVFETENAYVRGVYGNRDGWWQARLGVMHPWEGFGGSDRPIGLTRPLFQKQRATGSPFFLWNLDEMALEVGYYFATSGTSIAGRIGNGIIWKEDGSGVAEPAQGGELRKRADLVQSDAKSYQVFVNQFIRDDAGISLYYYHTSIPSPNPFNPDGTDATGPFTTDTLERLAIYANFFAVPEKVDLLFGYAMGDDKLNVPALAPNVGGSEGYFGEVDYYVIENRLAVGARYDMFDPSDEVGHDTVEAISMFASYMPVSGLQLVADYQHKTTDAGVTPGSTTDDAIELRVIFTW